MSYGEMNMFIDIEVQNNTNTKHDSHEIFAIFIQSEILLSDF